MDTLGAGGLEGLVAMLRASKRLPGIRRETDRQSRRAHRYAEGEQTTSKSTRSTRTDKQRERDRHDRGYASVHCGETTYSDFILSVVSCYRERVQVYVRTVLQPVLGVRGKIIIMKEFKNTVD